MELKPGFKQTEVGIIPEGWAVRSLSSLSENIFVGIASSATHAYRSKGTPLLRNQNIKSGYLDDSDILFVDEKYEHAFRNKRLQPGDLLTTRTGYPGITCIVPNHHAGSQSFTTLITRPKNYEIDSAYLCHYINSQAGQSFFEQSQIGGAQKNVNAGTLRGMPVPTPLVSEQRAIASTLSDVDTLISSLDQLIAKKRDIKQATMQQLLTGKQRLAGFSGEWKETRLGGECMVVTKGTTPTSVGRAFAERGVNFVKVESLTENGDVIPERLVAIDEASHQILRRSQLEENDILFSIAGALGRTAIVKRELLPANTNQALAIIRLNIRSCLHHDFLVKYLTSSVISAHIATISVQAAQANISLQDIRDFSIRAPSVAEQTAIASILSDMDDEIAALEQKRNKTLALKQGMMQELLTGRIRLV